MITALKNIDEQLLLFINGLHSPFLDQVMWVVSDAFFGIPFYFLFFYLAIHYFGWKKAAILILIGVLAVGLADLGSKYLFKEVFLRYRPTHHLLLGQKIHLVNDYRGGKYGFVSSHAANMFAIAVFLGASFYRKNKGILYLMLLWAALISYSRMYLGVHYPSDVFVGGLFGALIGFVLYQLTAKKLVIGV